MVSVWDFPVTTSLSVNKKLISVFRLSWFTVLGRWFAIQTNYFFHERYGAHLTAGGMTEPKRKRRETFLSVLALLARPVPVWTDQLARSDLLSNQLSRFEIISRWFFYWLSDWAGRETTWLLAFEQFPGERFLARFARRIFPLLLGSRSRAMKRSNRSNDRESVLD